MKIGVVCYPTYGGSGVVASELGIGMAKRGHEVHFITYKMPPRLSSFQKNLYFHEVSSVSYPLFEYSPYESALASKLVDVAIYEDLDIIHVHYAIPHAMVAYMAREILKSKNKRIPFITTLHGTDITLVGSDPSFAPVVEFSINNSDGVTAVSNFLRQETLNSFDISNDIRVIYNFIDFTRFKKENKSHFKKAIAPDGEKILVHISNFRKVKRVEDVVYIFQNVIERLDVKMLMIGDGPERKSIEDLCRSLGLCEHIRFLGKQDAVEELLAVSDLFILPSENESFGLAALEAMACEVPVISSNIGGLPEVNISGITGFTSKVGDIKDMSKNAIYILENEERHAQFSLNALQHAKKFNIDNIIPVYEDYYREVIEKVKFTALKT